MFKLETGQICLGNIGEYNTLETLNAGNIARQESCDN